MTDTATASPRPWRTPYPGEIEDANGNLLYNLRDCIGGGVDEANAALICDAVNLKARIDEAMADESGYLHPVVLDGKPMACVTPPPSEAEESRMHREYETSLLADRERFRRCYYEAAERNDRLRDIVRRLLPLAETTVENIRALGTARFPFLEQIKSDRMRGDINREVANADYLLREARAAIGEGEACE